MVHALQECRRVLKGGGSLIDLRPFYSQPAIEIITTDGIYVPGHVDDTGGATADITADEAITEVIRSGLFTLRKRASFNISDFWDTLDGLLEHAEEKWGENACIPPFVVAAARRCTVEKEGPYKIRIGKEMHIAVYTK
jgi:hypothetical protein